MAFNKCIVGGIVDEEPTFSKNGDEVEVQLKINRTDIGKVEYLTAFAVDNQVIRRIFDEVHKGDYFVSLNARLITRNYNKTKEIVCPHCQDVTYIQSKGEKTEVQIEDFVCLSNAKGTEEGINRFYLLGNVCSRFNYRQMPNGKGYIKYKVAINSIENGEEKAYFPFVVSFGKEADNANRNLHMNDRVFIEGAIQQREFTQKTECRCGKCGQSFIAPTPAVAREIITQTIKYLKEKKKEDFQTPEVTAPSPDAPAAPEIKKIPVPAPVAAPADVSAVSEEKKPETKPETSIEPAVSSGEPDKTPEVPENKPKAEAKPKTKKQSDKKPVAKAETPAKEKKAATAKKPRKAKGAKEKKEPKPKAAKLDSPKKKKAKEKKAETEANA